MQYNTTKIQSNTVTDSKILRKYSKILLKYSKNLVKKKEIIIFNKIDLINQNIINTKVSNFKKKVKKNIYKISILGNKGLVDIKKMLVNNVHR